MDITLINVALPTLADHFQVSVPSTEWLSTAYLLALAVIIPASGWAGDRFGNKKIFIVANFFILIGALCCSLSWSLNSMIFFRVIQGIGGGILVPVGMSMTFSSFSPSEYSKVASYTLIPTLIAPAIAPTLGGLILQFENWRWLFLFHIPISTLAIVLSFLYLKETSHLQSDQENHVSKAKFDLFGFLSASSGLSLLLYFISRLGHTGFDFIILAGFLTSASLFAFFIWWEMRFAFPMIDLKLFRILLFVKANIMQLFLQICYFGSIFLVALFFQEALGMSPFHAGLCLGAQPLGTIIMMPITANLFNRYGPRWIMFGGMLGLAFTTYSIFLIHQNTLIWVPAFILFLRGLCIGLVNVPVQALNMLKVEKSLTSRASAVFNAGRQVSISLGIAFSALFLKYGFRDAQITKLTDANRHLAYGIFCHGFLFLTTIALVGACIALFFQNDIKE